MNIRSKISLLREYLTPINTELNFERTGEISPAEFVAAGDFLVHKFPTWAWGSGPAELRKSFLPDDKQYLVTRHVPLYRRYADMVPGLDLGPVVVPHHNDSDLGDSHSTDDLGDDLGEWVPMFPLEKVAANTAPTPAVADLDLLMDTDVQDNLDEYTDVAGAAHGTSTRKYDMYIAYLTSYRVPKVYLVGFTGSGIPLVPQQMFEDIALDYKDKTATIEPLPMAFATTAVLVHPCRHALVMRVFMAHAPGHVRVDTYLVLFLKFISSVTPGIEYDFTMDALA